MKKSYKERFDEIHLKEEHKQEILIHVLNHDEKKQRIDNMKHKFASVAIALTLVIGASALFQEAFHSGITNHYVVKANDDLYEIHGDKIEMKDYRQVVSGYLFGTDSNGEILSFPLYSPLSVSIKGDNIQSITYTINQGAFYKINEVEKEPSPTQQGMLEVKKEANTFPQLTSHDKLLPGDNALPYWGFYLNAGSNQITVAYEDQGTVKGFYGISFHFTDKALVDTLSKDMNGNTELAEEKLIQTINHTKLDVQINFKDGTHETTQLKFVTNENNNTMIEK